MSKSVEIEWHPGSELKSVAKDGEYFLVAEWKPEFDEFIVYIVHAEILSGVPWLFYEGPEEDVCETCDVVYFARMNQVEARLKFMHDFKFTPQPPRDDQCEAKFREAERGFIP